MPGGNEVVGINDVGFMCSIDICEDHEILRGFKINGFGGRGSLCEETFPCSCLIVDGEVEGMPCDTIGAVSYGVIYLLGVVVVDVDTKPKIHEVVGKNEGACGRIAE
jgi:hypothetical protein